MAAGFNLEAYVDVGYCEEFTMAPASEHVRWVAWDFDERHWQRLSFTPVDEGTITILREWTTLDVSHDKWGERRVTTLWAHLRNDSGGVVTVQAAVLVAPTRYRS